MSFSSKKRNSLGKAICIRLIDGKISIYLILIEHSYLRGLPILIVSGLCFLKALIRKYKLIS